MSNEPTQLTVLLSNTQGLNQDATIAAIIEIAEKRWERLWDHVIGSYMPPHQRRAEGMEDAKQDALSELHKRLVMDFEQITPDEKRLKTGSDIRNWMCITSRNKAVDAVRRNSRTVGPSEVPKATPDVEPHAALDDAASAATQNVQAQYSPQEIAELRRALTDSGKELYDAVTNELSMWVNPDKLVVHLYLDFTTYLEMQVRSELCSYAVQRIIRDFHKRPGIRDALAAARSALLNLVTTSYQDAIDAVNMLPPLITRLLIDFRGNR